MSTPGCPQRDSPSAQRAGSPPSPADAPAAAAPGAPARVELRVERVVLRGAAAAALPAAARPAFARQLAAELQRLLQRPGAADGLGTPAARQRLRAGPVALHAPDAARQVAAAVAAALTAGGRR